MTPKLTFHTALAIWGQQASEKLKKSLYEKEKNNYGEKVIIGDRGISAFGGFGPKIEFHRSGLKVEGLCWFQNVAAISSADGLVSRTSWQRLTSSASFPPEKPPGPQRKWHTSWLLLFSSGTKNDPKSLGLHQKEFWKSCWCNQATYVPTSEKRWRIRRFMNISFTWCKFVSFHVAQCNRRSIALSYLVIFVFFLYKRVFVEA